MATNAIVSVSNLDISKVTFGEIRQNKAGGKTVPIKYNGQSLMIRLPKVSYPMGVAVRESENGTNYTLMATLKGCDPFVKERAGAESGELGSLYNFLLDITSRLLETATTNSSKWFGKARSRDVLQDVMKQSISPSVEKVNGEWVPTGKYPPSLRMKVPVYDGRVAMDVVDSTGKAVDITVENIQEIFPKRVEASVVVTPSVYVSGQGFGVTWRVSFARVSPPQRLTAAQVFADELEEDDGGVAEAPAPAPTPAGNGEAPPALNLHIPTAEELEEDSIAPAAPPAPAAAPKNRRRQVAH
jgi:hypothetical protein